MHGYVVSKGGTFGAVQRRYLGVNDTPMVVIRWGWCLTPVKEADCFQLRSSFESEAKAEAERILAGEAAAP